ncbi:MAG: hypothetical protein K8S98_15590 [Planctomycetes bacterium]|nr:hypothetical protein [Planctomycetota bacterium]
MNRSFQRVRRGSASLRLLALALLFVSGYFASFAHDVTVSHTLCAAHGEWVHDADASTVHEHAASSDDAAPRVRSAPGTSEGAHEHCGIVLVSRGERLLAPDALFGVAAPVLESPCSEVAYATPVREARIRSTPARGPPTVV